MSHNWVVVVCFGMAEMTVFGETQRPRLEPTPLGGGSSFGAADLVIDLAAGTTVKGVPDQKLARLQSVVYAINSINTETSDLLRVEDVLKANFKDGKIPEG